VKKVTYINRKEKWWFHATRSMNLFAFRFWWLVLLIFFLGLFVYYFFCFNQEVAQCEQYKKALSSSDNSIKKISNCCECEPEAAIMDSIPKAPQENCRVHFSGLFMGASYKSNFISEIYKVDDYSEYVGSGFYPNNELAFPKAVNSTFDGIAIDKGTRLIIYSQKNFQGKVLLDIIGPAIINNIHHKNNNDVNYCNTEDFPAHLQANYPQSVRKWSSTNMWEWSYGSCKIMCNE
jgi:hypothetical protein